MTQIAEEAAGLHRPKWAKDFKNDPSYYYYRPARLYMNKLVLLCRLSNTWCLNDKCVKKPISVFCINVWVHNLSWEDTYFANLSSYLRWVEAIVSVDLNDIESIRMQVIMCEQSLEIVLFIFIDVSL